MSGKELQEKLDEVSGILEKLCVTMEDAKNMLELTVDLERCDSSGYFTEHPGKKECTHDHPCRIHRVVKILYPILDIPYPSHWRT